MTALPALLVTVSSPEFLIGTRVVLHSFLAANAWFDGEIVVVHARLEPADVAALEADFPRLRCRTAAPPLRQAIARLAAAFPHLADRRDRFLSLETLLLPGGWPRLFIDSDVAVRGDLAPAFEPPGALIACPDAALLRGGGRDSFNAGMMLVREPRPGALAALEPAQWRAIASDHTDQAVWNRLYAGEVALADPRFNFMVGHAALYPAVPADIRLLHFNGRDKPWKPAAQAAASERGGVVGEAFAAWRRACQAMLAAS